MSFVYVLAALVSIAWLVTLFLIGRDIMRLIRARQELEAYRQGEASALDTNRPAPAQEDLGPLLFAPDIEPIRTKAQKRRQRRPKR